MHTTAGIPPSLWLSRPSPPEEVEHVVVGGGFVGLSTAYWLADRGKQVVLLEAEHLAGKASGRNAGFLLTGSSRPFTELAAAIGRDRALAFWQTSRDNRELLRRELLDPGRVVCDFLPEGSHIAALEGSGEAETLEESAEILRGEGFEVEWRGAAKMREVAGGARLGGALHQARDGGLNPVALCRGLAELGLFEVRTGVRVASLRDEGERVRLHTYAGDFLAERVVLAMNAYLPSLVPRLAVDIRPIRGQMLSSAPGERQLTGVWYLNRGFEYVRQLTDGTILAGGRRQVAEASEVGYLESPTATVQGALGEFLSEVFPGLAGRPVAARWAGTMAFTEDGLPRVGEVEHLPGALYATGFSGHGMSLGFAVGRYLARRACGEEVGELLG